MNKPQAEFLRIYGWWIFLILIVMASLIYLNINPIKINDVECPPQEICVDCQEQPETALVTTYFNEWGINENNENEVLFQTWIFNYGYKEAKDIVVECRVRDTSGRQLLKGENDIGNIASISTKLIEIKVPTNIKLPDGALGMCYITNCDDCEILDKRIPEIVKDVYD